MEVVIIRIQRIMKKRFMLVNGKKVKNQAWVFYIIRMDKSMTVHFKMISKMDLAKKHMPMVVHTKDSLETI